MSHCQETSGVLFAKTCPEPADTSCGRCHKKVCTQHQRQHAGQVVCVSCLRGMLEGLRDRGQSLPSQHRDDPFFFYYYHSGFADAFVPGDFALFDEDQEVEHDAAWAGS